MRFKRLSVRIQTAYWQWVVRCLIFHQHGGECRHLWVLGAAAVEELHADLTTRRKVTAATPNQALNALVLLGNFKFSATALVSFPPSLRQQWRTDRWEFLASQRLPASLAASPDRTADMTSGGCAGQEFKSAP